MQDEKAPICGLLSNHHQPAPVYDSRGNGDTVRRVPLWKHLLVAAHVYMWESGKETDCLSLENLGNCRSIMSHKKPKTWELVWTLTPLLFFSLSITSSCATKWLSEKRLPFSTNSTHPGWTAGNSCVESVIGFNSRFYRVIFLKTVSALNHNKPGCESNIEMYQASFSKFVSVSQNRWD